MADALEQLKQRLADYTSLDALAYLLAWDQRTVMPPAGFMERAGHMSLLERLAHEKLTDPEVGRLLDELEPRLDSLDPDSWDAAIIRTARRDYDEGRPGAGRAARRDGAGGLGVRAGLARGEGDVELRHLPAAARAQRRAAAPLRRVLREDRRAVRHPARRLRAGDEDGGGHAHLRRDQARARPPDRRSAQPRGRRLVPRQRLPDRRAGRARLRGRRHVRPSARTRGASTRPSIRSRPAPASTTSASRRTTTRKS